MWKVSAVFDIFSGAEEVHHLIADQGNRSGEVHQYLALIGATQTGVFGPSYILLIGPAFIHFKPTAEIRSALAGDGVDYTGQSFSVFRSQAAGSQ